jgi:hypothetical protein
VQCLEKWFDNSEESGGGYHNLELGRLLLGIIYDPNDDLEDEEAMDSFRDNPLRREIEADWDEEEYPNLREFLLSRDGERIRRLLALDEKLITEASAFVQGRDLCMQMGIILANYPKTEASRRPSEETIAEYRENLPKLEKLLKESAARLEQKLKASLEARSSLS